MGGGLSNHLYPGYAKALRTAPVPNNGPAKLRYAVVTIQLRPIKWGANARPAINPATLPDQEQQNED